MSSEVGGSSPAVTKDKKSKREHKSKKREREAEAQAEEERKHKRSKSEAPANGNDDLDNAVTAPADDADVPEKKKEKKRGKKKRRSSNGAAAPDQDQDVDMEEPAQDQAAEEPEAVELLKKEKKKKEKKKHQETAEEEPAVAAEPAIDDEEEKRRHKKEKKEKRRKEKEAQSHDAEAADEDAMDVDPFSSPSKPSNRPFGKLPDKPYPFFTQQVSQYLPLFPQGLIDPIEGYTEQHLKPLLNHYVPAFKGVLLGYHNVEIGEAPGRGSITEESGMDAEAVFESIDEYAVTFGWLTAKVDLFKPQRGAWLEGSVNMQTEGHLGVVCWDMFNASIEASRLPEGWRWVDLLGNGAKSKGQGHEKTPEEAKLPTPEPAADDVAGDDDLAQVHTTGYWVDAEGQRVRGTVRFQIKNYEIGVSGDYGYLSIEGTMLSAEVEKKKAADEAEAARRWKLKHGSSRRREYKRLPDFSMTKFGMEEEQEDESQRAEIWKGSRPASETAE
ncbi:hypothetical protein BX600DRAFT_252401 [Xylariales sp. PMI_506]|nr:hypothetical protein BX600DRAFT_252401 [Xylariales sp. PMI_506]